MDFKDFKAKYSDRVFARKGKFKVHILKDDDLMLSECGVNTEYLFKVELKNFTEKQICFKCIQNIDPAVKRTYSKPSKSSIYIVLGQKEYYNILCNLTFGDKHYSELLPDTTSLVAYYARNLIKAKAVVKRNDKYRITTRGIVAIKLYEALKKVENGIYDFPEFDLSTEKFVLNYIDGKNLFIKKLIHDTIEEYKNGQSE